MSALLSPDQHASPDLSGALQRYFRFPAFREGQEEIVRRAVEGRDTLALMPTGAGKSLCYQLAAMLRETPTLVVSPLIALMKDQIDNLPPEIGEHASLINSSLDPAEAARRLGSLAAGEYKLIYAAPERLRQRAFVSALRSVGVGLVVIDEVHCVSMWGHDFRPDYLFIRSALPALGDPVVLGLTATATRATESDISDGLGRSLEVVRASVVRKNLRYEVEHVENEDARLRTMLARVKGLGGSGIIYARSREKCEQLAALLQREGERALHYHARLDPSQRSRVQESFLGDKARVIVATTAFGMGIDKPDIRWVMLYNFPNSLENYVQMVGRAGRDGRESTCVLLASATDATNLKRFARNDIPTLDSLRNVYRQLRRQQDGPWAEVTPDELGADAKLGEDTDARVLVGMLERAGLVRRDFDAGRTMRVEMLSPPADAAGRIEELLNRYEQQALERAGRMIAFADARRCRHLQVAEHFGENVEVPCGMCDVCSSTGRTAGAPVAEPQSPPLPADIARAIVDAVGGLRWPLGQKGLIAMLRGSPTAARSAQSNPAFGVLAAAKEGTIKRWVSQLTESGHLEPFESPDGYKLLRVGRTTDLPNLNSPAGATSGGKTILSDADTELYDRLRAWQLETARESGVAPFMVLSGQAMREIAATRPVDKNHLAGITGIGPAKLEQYGDRILELVGTPATSPAAPTRGEAPPSPARQDPRGDLSPSDLELLDRLTDWRAHKAAEMKVPDAVILKDGVLRVIAATRPGGIKDLAAAGLSLFKIEWYGEDILRIVAQAGAG